VWLNPPFSNKNEWYARLSAKYRTGDIDRAAAVASGDTSTDWFHEHFTTADVVVFLDGRDWYIGHGSSPSFTTMVGVWDPTPDAIEWAQTVGTVARFDSADEQTTLF
jgi:hypothetical protein